MRQDIGALPLQAFEDASVLQEQQKRKQVEHDANRLRNRLLQLERQTEKADKRIVQTKKRAKDILDQRERNERRELERQCYIEELQEELRQHRQDIAKCADARSAAIQQCSATSLCRRAARASLTQNLQMQ
jgi:tRNA uridine 5-carbamoylmethylation protein Kti12